MGQNGYVECGPRDGPIKSGPAVTAMEWPTLCESGMGGGGWWLMAGDRGDGFAGEGREAAGCLEKFWRLCSVLTKR